MKCVHGISFTVLFMQGSTFGCALHLKICHGSNGRETLVKRTYTYTGSDWTTLQLDSNLHNATFLIGCRITAATYWLIMVRRLFHRTGCCHTAAAILVELAWLHTASSIPSELILPPTPFPPTTLDSWFYQSNGHSQAKVLPSYYWGRNNA